MRNPANYHDYETFFKSIAEQHKLLNHFFYGYDQFNSAIKANKTKLEGWIMVLEPYDNKGSESRSDNYMATRQGMLVVCHKKQGALSKLDIEANAEPIVQDIQTYLIDLYRRCKITTQFKQFIYSPIAPMFTAAYCGLALDFAFEVTQPSRLNPDRWNLTPETP